MFDAGAGAAAIVEIFATGDLNRVRDLIAVGYLDHQGLDGIGIQGREGFERVVAAARSLQGMRVSIEDVLAVEDRAALRLRWRGVDSAGREVMRETLDLLRFENGLLAEHWGAEISRQVR